MTEEKFLELYRAYKPIQDNDEIWPLIRDYLMPNKVCKIIELGTEFGGSSIIWNQLCQEGNGWFVGVDGEPERAQNMLYNSTTPVNMVKGNTMHQTTVDGVEKILNGDLADFLFIDADHMSEAVYLDSKNYLKFVKSGGFVAYHDYGDKNGGPRAGVLKAKQMGVIQPLMEKEFEGRMGIYLFQKA